MQMSVLRHRPLTFVHLAKLDTSHQLKTCFDLQLTLLTTKQASPLSPGRFWSSPAKIIYSKAQVAPFWRE